MTKKRAKDTIEDKSITKVYKATAEPAEIVEIKAHSCKYYIVRDGVRVCMTCGEPSGA